MRRFRTESGSRPARVVLHIGAPLTGATFLREALSRNRRRLTRQGFLFPSTHVGGTDGHRDAVLDVLDLVTPGAGTSTGAWERLAQAARDWRRGTVVVSHELLADADEDQVHRIVGSFGPVEVDVVYVARDLARQLPLAWQEWVRNGGTATFEAYVARVARRDGHRLSRVFWRSHDVTDVLGRWAEVVPADRIHVVTVPDTPDQDLALWSRFAAVVGIDPTRLRVGVDGSRRLDALAASEALRLLNAAGTRGLPLDVLAGVEGPAPAPLPDHAEWVDVECERSVDAVKRGGYSVVGDVTELRPAESAWARQDSQAHATAADVVRAQTTLLAAVLHS